MAWQLGRSNGRRGGVMLCGVDGSRVAREALRAAERLAERLGLGLVAVHVVAPVPVRTRPWAAPMGATSVEELAAGETLLERVCADCEGRVERRVVAGRPAERLAEIADDEDAELIVVGSRGQRLLQAAFVGSVASELLGLAACPVLVLPAQAVDWDAG